MYTPESVANERIEQRKGHFYVGKQKPTTTTTTKDSDSSDDEINIKPPILSSTEKNEVINDDDNNNSEWNFVPVTFPHIILDGNDPVETNAQRVASIVYDLVVDSASAARKTQ